MSEDVRPEPKHETLTVVVDLDALPTHVIADFMIALDRLHRAYGGAGLTLTRSDAYRDPNAPRDIGVFELTEKD